MSDDDVTVPSTATWARMVWSEARTGAKVTIGSCVFGVLVQVPGLVMGSDPWDRLSVMVLFVLLGFFVFLQESSQILVAGWRARAEEWEARAQDKRRWCVVWVDGPATREVRRQECDSEDEARVLYDLVAVEHINREWALQGVPNPVLLASRMIWSPESITKD